jgi:2-polyprenyl-3-methyl-5-hydroxy-6-metoxy-1,4-benzoquinol methylase
VSSIKKKLKCACCENENIIDWVSYINLPGFLFPVGIDLVDQIDAKALNLKYCNICNHIFYTDIDQSFLDKIYTEYYANYPFDSDESLFSIYRKPFNYFFDLITTNMLPESGSKKLLEIGCSKPSNLNQFVEKGYSCTGIDPSPLSQNEFNNDKINMISGYYENVKLNEKYNIIISRFNLEHITDLKTHTQKMREDLDDNGIVIIQVPNIAYYIEKKQPLFVAHEHIHYFFETSLNRLFEQQGFKSISNFSFSQPSILACYTKNTNFLETINTNNNNNMYKDLKSWSLQNESKKNTINKILSDKTKVTFYGCGLSLFWVLENISLEIFKKLKISIVDDNPSYIEKYLPFYRIKVQDPSKFDFAETDLVVLTLNPLYRPKVKHKIEKKFQNIKLFEDV